MITQWYDNENSWKFVLTDVVWFKRRSNKNDIFIYCVYWQKSVNCIISGYKDLLILKVKGF